MKIVVNGDAHDVPDESTVLDLVHSVHGSRGGQRGIAVAVAGEVVPRSTWSQRELRPADQVEILTAVQGG